jgi:ubiquinone/menaquinone biosynthesis C-methylase UbiE
MNKFGQDNEISRQIWVKQALKKIQNGKLILDAGAGKLQYKKYCSHLKYYSQDFSSFNESTLKEGLRSYYDYSGIDVVSDIEYLPFKTHAFDVVLCTEVLEHIPNPLHALKEFSRVLRPGGILILTAPFISFTHYAPYHYSTGFSKFYYKHHLPKINLEIKLIEPNGNYFSFLAQELLNLPSRSYSYTKTNISLLAKAEKFVFRFISQISVRLLIQILAWFSKYNSESEKLVCYGYHVIAIKKSK